MATPILCPRCGAKLEVSHRPVGSKVACAKCGVPFVLAASGSVLMAPVAPTPSHRARASQKSPRRDKHFIHRHYVAPIVTSVIAGAALSVVTMYFSGAREGSPSPERRSGLEGSAVAERRSGPVYLADMQQQQVSAFDFRKGPTSGILKGVRATKGLFLHPPDRGVSAVTYRLKKDFHSLAGSVGIDDEANLGRGSGSPLTFQIKGDDAYVWKSQPIQQCGKLEAFNVSVAGAEWLTLEVFCPASRYCAHAVWLDPVLN